MDTSTSRREKTHGLKQLNCKKVHLLSMTGTQEFATNATIQTQLQELWTAKTES